MSILTKEGIQKILNDDWLLMDDCEGLENCTVIKELARMALAAMDSEPDCKERKLFCSTDTTRMRKTISVSAGTEDAPLYRHAQPAPVVPEKATVGEMPFLGASEGVYVRGWNDCRAAMLQENPKSAGESNNCRSNENVQVLQAGNSPVIPDRWIPVSERMPELDARVLLYFSDYDGHIEDGCIGDDGYGPYHYFFDGDSLRHEPTHWMPLPAAPQEEK